MYKCLICGTGAVFVENWSLVKNLEEQSEIIIEGITSNDNFYKEIYGYKFVERQNIKKEDYDIVIVMTNYENYKCVLNEFHNYGFSTDAILPYKVLKLYGFSINKYRELKKNTPTIISSNCWGGIIYNALGLEFKSPFINMFENHDDYIKILMNLKYYINQKLHYYDTAIDDVSKKEYPIASCGDVLLHFNHYSSFEDALQCWERRKARINWDNLFIMFFEDDVERAMKFDEIPYEKKICFTSFPIEKKGFEYLDCFGKGTMKGKELWQIVNEIAQGKMVYYDFFELLLYGQIIKLCEF